MLSDAAQVEPMSSMRVGRRGDQLVAVKSGDAAGAARLRREAEILDSIDHPGVVEIVEIVDGESTELHTVYVGTDSWVRTPPSSPRALADEFSSLAETVADLHSQGISHGALRAEHVLVGADARPVLCGFGDAAALDATTELADMTDLAALLRELSARVPEADRFEFDALARHTTSGEIDARTLAEALRETGHSPPPRRSIRLSPAKAGALALMTAVAATVVFLWARPSADAGAAPGPIAPSTTAPPTTAFPAAASPSTAPPTLPPAVPPSTVALSPTPETTPVEIIHEGRRYALGRAGDVVVLGDWNCDGIDTPALLQLDSGTVAIFATWPEAGADIAATATAASPEALGLDAVESGDCHQLRVIEPRGSHLFTPEL